MTAGATTRPRRRRVVLIVLAVVLVVGGVLAALLGSASESTDGVGDPYYPRAGAGGYDALAYRVDVDWDEESRELRGATEIRLRPRTNLTAIRVDLALTVDSATIDGQPAEVVAGVGTDRRLRGRPVLAGREVVVVIRYHGLPEGVLGTQGRRVAQREGRELVLSGEPVSSPAWYPANDHPSDPATFDITATVPSDLQAISIGRLVERDADDDPATATWRWATQQPTPTYATALVIGSFELEETEADGRPYLYAVSTMLSPAERGRAFAALRQTPQRVRELEAGYGPYPVDAGGGLVTAVDMWFVALETFGRPVYGRELVDGSEEERQSLIVHENAHMWFGNSVTLASWDDIVMNEGFATHAEWLVVERSGGVDADARLRASWERAGPAFWRPSIADPRERNMFGTTYRRGGMALEALRNVLGAEAFDALAREWAAQRGPRSYEDFRALAEQRAGRDLDAFFDAWYSAGVAPPMTAQYGWPA